MRKELSCGIIIDTENGLLAMLPYGRLKDAFHNYDLAKGHIEEGETPMECALRELQEESGIVLSDEQKQSLVDLGVHKYIAKKDLHLFYLSTEIAKDFQFKCSTNFALSDGRERPEMVGYRWVHDLRYYFRSMCATLSNIPQLAKYKVGD
jgi:8-oxo-dGTP pyrophosphatase MutT (NUDIX family)